VSLRCLHCSSVYLWTCQLYKGISNYPFTYQIRWSQIGFLISSGERKSKDKRSSSEILYFKWPLNRKRKLCFISGSKAQHTHVCVHAHTQACMPAPPWADSPPSHLSRPIFDISSWALQTVLQRKKKRINLRPFQSWFFFFPFLQCF